MKNALLLLFPYWSPVVPPAGLARIKAYLESQGHRCKVVDLNSKKETLTLYRNYYGVLKKYIAGAKRGTLYNLGNDLMEQHLMAYVLRGEDTPLYRQHVAQIVRHVFQIELPDPAVDELDDHIADYLTVQQRYLEYLVGSVDPAMVGVTLYKTTLPLSIHGLRTVKAIDCRIVTAVGGGVFVDTLNRDTPEFQRFLRRTTDCIDKVVIGEGERIAQLILEGAVPADQRCLTPDELPVKKRSEWSNWPVPDFSDFNTFKYSHLVATASTGCPFACTFCNELQFYGEYRKRTSAAVIPEMIELSERNHGKRLFFMTDSLLNPVVDDLCASVIVSERRFYMDTYFRVSRQAARLEKCLFWRRGGLYRVRLGVESGSQRMLDLMDKKSTLAEIRDSLRSLSRAGIKTTTYWIIGHPGEMEGDFQATLNLLEEMKDCIWQAECNPFRYYPLANNRTDEWGPRSVPVFSPETEEFYLYSPYRVEGAPEPEVVQDRVNRFILHIGRLKIPNPYTAYDTYLADQRWKELHPLAVPSIQDVNGDRGGRDLGLETIEYDLVQRTGTMVSSAAEIPRSASTAHRGGGYEMVQ